MQPHADFCVHFWETKRAKHVDIFHCVTVPQTVFHPKYHNWPPTVSYLPRGGREIERCGQKLPPMTAKQNNRKDNDRSDRATRRTLLPPWETA